MTTKTKLLLGFGLLTLLLVMSSLAIMLRIQSSEAQVEEMADVARPRMSAASHLETSVRGYALAVRARLQGVESNSREDAEREAAEVDRYLEEYDKLAAARRERDLAARFALEWAEFKKVGQALLETDNPQSDSENSRLFFTRRLAIENLLTSEIQPDATEAYNMSRDASVADVRAVERLTLILLIFGTLIAVAASIIIGSAIVSTEDRKTAMFETALDAIISIDARGFVTEFNPAAEETFKYSREEVIGRELAALIIPPAMREAHRRGLAHYLATGEGPVLNQRIELSALRADQTEFPVELSITRVKGRGAPQFTAYLRDITDRKAAEDAMLQANEMLEERVEERTAELNESNLALSRSNKELEQFASVASHDLQEPLRKIQAFGDRLRKKYSGELGEQGRTYVERMDYSATRMRTLIDSLLNFSRITTKAEPFVPTDLGSIAAEVVDDLEGRLHESNGRVEIGGLPEIDADPLQMRQLFQNLIGNGLKFTKPGESSVVTISGRVQGDRCELMFADNGIGFEEIYLDRIFEVFQRLHGRQEYEGTGMGLAICRKIVERHGGQITATSSLDNGSTFLVTLPVRQEGFGS